MTITASTNYAYPKPNLTGMKQVTDEVATDLRLIVGTQLRDYIARKALEQVWDKFPTHRDFYTSEQNAWNYVEAYIEQSLEHYSGRSRK